jgi:hypothetical protein
MVSILIYAIGATLAWSIVHSVLFYAIGWRGGVTYWALACGLIPAGFVAYGSLLLMTFVPPEVFDPNLPDPGPLNFFHSMIFGFVPALLYVVVSIPLSAFALWSSRSK